MKVIYVKWNEIRYHNYSELIITFSCFLFFQSPQDGEDAPNYMDSTALTGVK